MENIISSNIVAGSDVAPWYYAVNAIVHTTICISIISFEILSILIIINKIKHKKISKKIIIVWLISVILFFVTYATPIIEDILIDIFEVLYGY